MMMRNRTIGIILLLLTAISVSAQKAERDYIRKGNRAYKDSTYVNAEVNYRKAIDVNPKSAISMYNLGNTLMQQNKLQEAMEQFVAATKMENDKVGMIVFAGDAFTQLPITSDYISAKMFLESINPSLISKQGTAIGAAINLATRSFTPQEGVGRAVIVITDGENHEGGAVEAAVRWRRGEGTAGLSGGVRRILAGAAADGGPGPAKSASLL